MEEIEKKYIYEVINLINCIVFINIVVLKFYELRK